MTLDHRVPNVTPADCKLIGAGDGSVMVYCAPCRLCLCPRGTTLNAALGFWEEHATADPHLVEPEPERAPTPDPWTDPDAAALAEPPPF